ncbi:MAG: hypothetical protein AAGC91_12880 [Pseudomonadota bacterium]
MFEGRPALSEALLDKHPTDFNLVFSGHLRPGTDEKNARRLLAAFFGLSDPQAIARFFSGRPIALRRKLRKQDALKLYQQLRSAGLICDIVADNDAYDSSLVIETAATQEGRVDNSNIETVTGKDSVVERKPPRRHPVGDATKASDNAPGPEKEAIATTRGASKEAGRSTAHSKAGKPKSTKEQQNPILLRETNRQPGSDRISAPPRQQKKEASRTAQATRRNEPRQAEEAHRGNADKAQKSKSKSPSSPGGSAQSGINRPAGRSDTSSNDGQNGKAPNVFALRPALERDEQVLKAPQASMRALTGAAAAIALLLITLAVTLRFPPPPAAPEPIGPLASLVFDDNRLLLLSSEALLLHARSGLSERRITVADLGVRSLRAPMLALDERRVVLNAELPDGGMGLLECDLDSLSCVTFAGAEGITDAIAAARSSLGAAVHILSSDGMLNRIEDGKKTEAAASDDRTMASNGLRMEDGLLLSPAEQGPLLGVYRPDIQSYGEQLDALFLLAELPGAQEITRIQDVIATDAYHWAILVGADLRAWLYRFDRGWGDPRLISTTPISGDGALMVWRDRIALGSRSSHTILRYDSEGLEEAPFISELLLQEHDLWLSNERQRIFRKHLGIGVPVFFALIAAAYAALNAAAAAALRQIASTPTELLDPMPTGVVWAVAEGNRESHIQQAIGRIAILGAAALLLLFATLPAKDALVWIPALALGLHGALGLSRGGGGNVGVHADRAIVVDNEGRYYYGRRKFVHFGERFVVTSRVVVPVALPLLPNLDFTPLRALLTAERKLKLTAPPLTRAQVLGALWAQRHPWIRGACTALFGVVLSCALFLLTSRF